MSLPLSRPRTYVDGVPLIPDDVNEAFDAIIDSKHAPREIQLPVSSAFLWNAGGYDHANGSQGRYLESTGPTETLSLPIQIPPGSRITNIVIGYDRQGSSGNFGVGLVVLGLDGEITGVASLLDNSSSGIVTKDLATDGSGTMPFFTPAGKMLSLDITANAGARFYGAILTVDRL